MPGLLDWLRGRNRPPAPESPTRPHSPPERGEVEGPTQFNVRDTVEARGEHQAGAVAVADGVRRPLPGDFVVPDGTYGTVKGVDLQNIFVAFPVEVPRTPWRHSRASDGPEVNVGDRLKSVGPVQSSFGVVPANHVVNVLDDLGDTLRVSLMLQFPKGDWHNRKEPDLRAWGATDSVKTAMATPTKYQDAAMFDEFVRLYGDPTRRQPVKHTRLPDGGALLTLACGHEYTDYNYHSQETYHCKDCANALNKPYSQESSTLEDVLSMLGVKFQRSRGEELIVVTGPMPNKYGRPALQASGSVSLGSTRTIMPGRFFGVDVSPETKRRYSGMIEPLEAISTKPKSKLLQEVETVVKEWVSENLRTEDERTAKRQRGDEVARGSLEVLGFPVAIEYFEGEHRPPYDVTCPGHYGYFEDTVAADGDSVDVILGPRHRETEPPLWVVEQLEPDGSGETLQFKVMVGWQDADEVRAAFCSMWPKHMLGELEQVDASEFVTDWLPELDVGKQSNE